MEYQRVDVAVVGGGIVGLSVAWRLGQRGRSVRVFERGEAGRGTSWAAAGMLSPATEIGFEELDSYEFGRESLRRWQPFARELEAASGSSVGYRDDGTLVVATDRDEREALVRLFRFQQEQQVPVQWLTGEEATAIEPLLSPGLPGVLFSPEDHQVNNREVVSALSKVIREVEGVNLSEKCKVCEISEANDAVVLLSEDGSTTKADAVVIAAGAWSRDLVGISERLPVRPIKGQILSLQMTDSFSPKHVVRGPDAYVVPKSDGRLVVGATSEEMGFNTDVTAGGIFRILEGAIEMMPGVEELQVTETQVGFRPASRDHAPLVGWLSKRVMVATGHFRNGILLAPITADEVALDVDARLAGRLETSSWIAPFSPRRFSNKPIR